MENPSKTSCGWNFRMVCPNGTHFMFSKMARHGHMVKGMERLKLSKSQLAPVELGQSTKRREGAHSDHSNTKKIPKSMIFSHFGYLSMCLPPLKRESYFKCVQPTSQSIRQGALQWIQ